MKNVYFTAGPSQVYSKIPQFINEAIENEVLSMSHRGEKFQELFNDVRSHLKQLLNIPQENQIFFLSSANEAWEKIIENCVETHSFHFINGAFGKRLFQISGELKKTPASHEVEFGYGFDFKNVAVPENAEVVCITHNESSTGVATDIKKIHDLKKQNPKKLFALDTVSSMPYVDVDFSLIDCIYFSVQKGFGLPAGLGVIVLTPAAMEKSEYLQQKGLNIGSYHNFPTQLKFAQKGQTPETPNVLNIYLLNKVVEDMLNIGIDTIRKETDKKAELMYGFFDKQKEYELFVKSKEDRSPTVVVAKTPENSKKTIEKLKQHNIIIGKGYGPYKDEYVRISNFPTTTIANVKKLLEYL